MDEKYALIPSHMFSGTQNRLETDMALIIDNGTIEQVVSVQKVPKDLECLYLNEGTLMPGLIDVHVHLDTWQLPLYLANGITTVRDVGNNLEWIMKTRKESQDPDAVMPRILCCGPFIDGMPYYHGGMTWGMKSCHDIQEAVKRLSELEVDAIKLYEGLELEMIKEGAREAKKHGIHTLGHFGSKVSVIDAIKAGVDEVEHLTGTPELFCREVVDEIIRNSIWVVPTQAVFEQVTYHLDDNEENDLILSSIPQNISDSWATYRKRVNEKPDEHKNYCSSHKQYISSLIENNARIAIGTDAPCQWVMPGSGYINELKTMKECGMSSYEVLKCATGENAKLLHIFDEAGTLEAGKRADMIFVEGDPLKCLDSVSKVKYVFKGGRKYKSSDLFEHSKTLRHESVSMKYFGKKTDSVEDWRKCDINICKKRRQEYI